MTSRTLALGDAESGVIVVGGTDGRAIDLMRRARAVVPPEVPIIFAGPRRGARRC